MFYNNNRTKEGTAIEKIQFLNGDDFHGQIGFGQKTRERMEQRNVGHKEKGAS